MNQAKITLLLFVCLVIGFLLGLGIKYQYESTTFKPYSWGKPPAIVNCYGSKFNKEQMERAIEYWESRNYPVGFYEHDPPKSVCKNRWLDGFIILRESYSLPHSTIASTKRISKYFEMKGAVIYYQPGAYNIYLINEHELGHALGFAHVDIPNHIMNPLYHNMGKDFFVPD